MTPGKRSRLITGWRQVKVERGTTKRWSFPETTGAAHARTIAGDATANDRWESEGGRISG